jgi:predicted peroxiredoxin
MRTSIVAVAVLVAAALISIPLLHAQQPAKNRDGVFIHLTHGVDNPHRVAMALQMAAMMAEDKDVLVYCDIKGIDVVLKDGADIQFSHFPSSKAQLQKLTGHKVTVMACPGCLKAAGKTEADLAEGVQVADKNAFFSFTKGRILSLDY